jgi:hypothetical protein
MGDPAKGHLAERLRWTYPGIVFRFIGAQLLVVPAAVLWRYWLATGVFMLRDDGRSKGRRLERVGRWWRARARRWEYVATK